MTDISLIVGVTGVELAVAYRYTSRALVADSHVQSEYGESVRDAVLDLEASKLTPLLAELFEVSDRIRRQRPWIDDEEDPLDDAAEIEERKRRLKNLLSRGELAPKIRRIGKTGAVVRQPVAARDSYARRWRQTCWPLLLAQICAPILLLDEMAERDLLSEPTGIIVGTVFGVSVLTALGLGLTALRARTRLAQAIAASESEDGD